MAYVGNPIDTTNTFQSLVGKRFNGDGSTTAFTLDVAPSSTLDIEVFVGNVRQDPNSAYTLSGTTLTFTGAPPSGTNNIYVVHQAKAVGTIDAPPGSLDLNGGNLTIDADADTKIIGSTDDRIEFSIAGSGVGNFTNSSSDFVITSGLQDKDIVFKGDDGGSAITAMTLDMSDGGVVSIRTGVGFPATQVANSGANVLDDYEEGIFVPTVGSLTLNDKFGHYTKIGRAVSVQGYVDMGSQSGGTTVVVGGLPFTSASHTQYLDVTGDYSNQNPQALRVQSSSTNASLVTKTNHSDNNNSDFNYNDMNGKYFYFHGVYFV